jgi:2-methylcitrate dehydratase PrpD
MSNETRTLASFCSSLSFAEIPDEVVHRAKQCVADTVAAIIFGAKSPCSRIVADQARRISSAGRCVIIGSPGASVQPGAAALAMGTAAHAFELDSLRRPGAGVHPGATLVPAAFALAQHLGKGGKDVILAFVAGCEVQFRIGDATQHSAESRGFHAPGLTGPLGAAVVAGRLFELDGETMTNALGIAGSLSGGLLEFASSGTGGMVKRLHLGRSAESGILAASLARDGFTGPATVLEGKNGFLRAFCLESDPQRLTRGLNEIWETKKICFKRYPCHITAHTPIEAARSLAAEHGFAAREIETIVVRGSAKMEALHNIQVPADLIMAQYSIPWCIAAALVGDPQNPTSFSQQAFHDPRVAALSARTSVIGDAPAGLSSWGTEVSVRLSDGRAFKQTCDDFPGTPEQPLTDSGLRSKFLSLARDTPNAETYFERLMKIDAEETLDWLANP